MLRAADLHAQLGASWPAILAQLGIPEESLRPKKPGPCPACGGRDRFTFDNRKLRGDFFCRGCGAGDGFALLMRVYGWGFPEARRQVMRAAGLDGRDEPTPRQTAPIAPGAANDAPPTVATPSNRVRALVRSACAVAECPDAVDYLDSRGLWPLPPDCELRAHPTVDYWQDGHRVGKFPALLAEVRDHAGALVTAHVTYLHAGRKLEGHEPRKLLGPLTGREGCAVRLMPAGELLGIAEGIETALSAAALDGVPVWAALNTTLLGKFEPPPACRRFGSTPTGTSLDCSPRPT
ncbi:phage P4 alpha, zinc-binding domain protein [mine drainage metagenome]|uniref:Phage P4 alpha, zinc-binding domain protein n=1 Tax=mine drainage metagenome TaxID=410659 RepID=T1BLY9_9ZZZZ